ncbi:methyl-accepting chemotaxis protein [Alteraurantiacibacter palmitatis]|uniref:Methyl-accepting chemotaxis protein n=1 Tax=Alteraurantiacibacter palmitatis TaxID=2054628 RepID=A0ABV7E749_9SPHN
MNDLDNLRFKGLRIIALIAAGCGAVGLGYAVYAGEWLLPVLLALVASGPAWLAISGNAGLAARCMVGAALPVMAALFTAMAKGSGWMIDMHMTFFAFMAIAALLADWRPIVVATLVTALHHLLLNFAAPLYVFPDGANLARVLFHAVVVLVEAGALVALCSRLEAFVIGQAEEKRRNAEQDALIRAEREAVSQEQREVLDKVGARLKALADGRLSDRIENAFPPDYEGLRTTLNDTASELQVLVGTVLQTVQGVVTGASEIRSAADDLARRIETDAESMEQVARTSGQLNTDMREASRLCQDARGVTQRMKDHVDQGLTTIGRVTAAMHRIESSSGKIESIVEIIDGLAFQTNLLALNAGVEAARAGESGKGFAVVAHEVRQLAQRSAEAASSIKGLIAQSSEEVRLGSEQVGQMDAVLSGIVENFAAVNAQIDQIAQRSEKTADDVGNISGAISRLESSHQQNAAMVEQSSAAAHALSAMANALRQSVARFEDGGSGAEPARARDLKAA